MNNRYFFIYVMLFFLTGHCPLYAQYENVWAFGHYAGLDFNSGKAEFVRTAIDGFGEASASVCNAKGELLFYTEGTIAWNRNGVIMADSLVPIKKREEGTSSPTSSACQGTIIVPMPGTENRYYIFSMFSIEYRGSYGRLYYSVVDMNLNNGLGGVLPGQKGIFLDSNLKEPMTAIAGSEFNTWLITKAQDNFFNAYSISACGIARAQRSQAIDKSSRYGGGASTGQIVATSDGKKLAACYMTLAGGVGGVELYDFDRSTGKVSNPLSLVDGEQYYGAAFSPDNSKLYLMASEGDGLLYQVDLSPSSPSTRLIGTGSFSQLRLAPDGKIYFVPDRRERWLGTINFPDRAGTACGYTKNAIEIPEGSSSLAGFPNVVVFSQRDTTRLKPLTTFLQAPCWIDADTGYILHTSQEGWDYFWDDSSTTANRAIHTAGKYWVRYYTKPCRLQVDTFIVNYPFGVLPSIDIEASCRNEYNGKASAHTYPGDTVRYSYTWRNDRNDIVSLTSGLQNVPAGRYALELRTAQCDTILYIDIPIVEDRVAFTTDSLVCVLDTIQLQNISGTYYTDFAWSFGDHTFSGLSYPAHRYHEGGQYNIRLVGRGSQCSDTAYQTIIVDAVQPVSFSSAPGKICAGQYITLMPHYSNQTSSGQSWSLGDGSVMHTDAGATVRHAYDQTGRIPVILTAHFRACPDMVHTDTVIVEPVPAVNLGVDSFLCLGQGPVILANKLPSAQLHYVWNTGATTPEIRVFHPGTYTLTVSFGALGCSATETVEVRKDCYANMPNAFTPNGDGANDYFFPGQFISSGLTNFKMQVFDRWGQLLFETTSIGTSGWDGRFMGKEQPQAVYVYRITAQFKDHRREQYEGNVTLIR